MPGLTYNSSGVKDLINAVQGYPVRDENQLRDQLFLNATAFREKAPVLQPSHTFLQGERALLKLSFGVYCQVSTVFPEAIKLVCPVDSPRSLTHTWLLAATCTGGNHFQAERGERVLYIFRIRISFFSVRGKRQRLPLCVCKPPPPQSHRSPLPCTTVCPRGCCLACTWARACSGPDWDINYSERLGVYFRCLRQVRIGGRRSEGRGSKRVLRWRGGHQGITMSQKCSTHLMEFSIKRS